MTMRAEEELSDLFVEGEAEMTSVIGDARGEAEMLDLQAVREDVDAVARLKLPLHDRAYAEQLTTKLSDCLRWLLAEETGAEDPLIRAYYQDAYRLLAVERRPTIETTSFGVWSYLHQLALQVTKFTHLYEVTRKARKTDR
ncbi:hypothetical protein RCO28_30930 [Streptomyces sp. LHD-70]|uniref:hypothetical protein n=1 Tax=Streptomyces sp. LHD-70 TaxID=3072140 RepID=UPI00280C84FE|nr:hypothetical protein [Streptomyces sp. LHD-70]MDQ8706852.1 hypothetical protein [Streptomyces sp. LHD-70]